MFGHSTSNIADKFIIIMGGSLNYPLVWHIPQMLDEYFVLSEAFSQESLIDKDDNTNEDEDFFNYTITNNLRSKLSLQTFVSPNHSSSWFFLEGIDFQYMNSLGSEIYFYDENIPEKATHTLAAFFSGVSNVDLSLRNENLYLLPIGCPKG